MRNEQDLIGQMIKSVSEVVGEDLAGIVLIDTGSTDGTIDVAKNAISNLESPLEVCSITEEPWVNFGANRTQLLQVTRSLAKSDDYLLMLDPDTTVEGNLPDVLNGDGYELEILGVGDISYRLPQLLSVNREWRFTGVVHEVLDDYPGLPYLDYLKIRNHGKPDHIADGRFERDQQLLSDQIDKRGLFYLAQTERDLGNIERASELYDLRASLGGWGEEVYYSLYQSGFIRKSITGLMKAWESRPTRGEALYHLICLLRHKQEYMRTAHALSTIGFELTRPDDVLFVEPWIYEWGLTFEHSITSYWVDDFTRCIEISENLLEHHELPDEFREAAVRNLEIARSRSSC